MNGLRQSVILSSCPLWGFKPVSSQAVAQDLKRASGTISCHICPSPNLPFGYRSHFTLPVLHVVSRVQNTNKDPILDAFQHDHMKDRCYMHNRKAPSSIP